MLAFLSGADGCRECPFSHTECTACELGYDRGSAVEVHPLLLCSARSSVGALQQTNLYFVRNITCKLRSRSLHLYVLWTSGGLQNLEAPCW